MVTFTLCLGNVHKTIKAREKWVLLTCVEVKLVAVGSFVVELPVRERDVSAGWVGVFLAKAKAPEEVEGVRQVLRSIRTVSGLTSVAIIINCNR